MEKFSFTKGVENLIDPINVGSLHFIQFFNNFLPKNIQRKLVKSASNQTPYMGFVVEPYSFFLCYEIKDIILAQTLIPEGFDLVKTSIFDNDEPKYYCIIGCITAHTSAFWGSRVEFYIIAENKKTGLLSWLIIDYDTNTISYDSKRGLMNPNASKSIITTNYDGFLVVDINNNNNIRRLEFDSDIKKGILTKLDQRLWVEGNLSVGYGKDIFSKDADVFSLKFDPLEMTEALQMPLSSLNMKTNTWLPGLFEENPSQMVCFPYAQHFISDSPGYSSNIKNKSDLISAIETLDFNRIKVFSTESFKLMFMVGSILSFFTFIILLIVLFSK